MSPTRPAQGLRATGRHLSFLTATVMLFSLAEASLPRIVPFFRIGLSNLSLMLALQTGFCFPSFIALAGLKVLVQGIVGGTLLSYVTVLSAASTLGSSLTMFLISRLRAGDKGPGWVGISMAGALVGNISQTLAGTLFLGRQALYLFPLIGGLGLVSSAALGLWTERFFAVSDFPAVLRETCPAPAMSPAAENTGHRIPAPRLAAAVILVAAELAMLVLRNIWLSLGLLLASAVFRLAAGLKVRPLRTIILLAALALLSLFTPSGKVLLDLGALSFTDGALLGALTRGLTLCASVGISRLVLFCLDARNLGALGGVMSYLGAMTGAFSPARDGGFTEAADKALRAAWRGDV